MSETEEESEDIEQEDGESKINKIKAPASVIPLLKRQS